MMIHLQRLLLLLPLVLTTLLKLTNAQVTFTFEKTSCHYAGESLVLVAAYTGILTVTQVDWYFEHNTGSNLPISDLVACIRFGAPAGGYPNNRMNFTCDTGTNIYKANIFNLDGTENGEWGVIFSLNDSSTTTLSKRTFTLCTGCNVPSVNNSAIDVTGTVQENVVATVTCNEGFVIVGSSSTTTSTHTCQSDGTWVPVFPSILCEKPPCNLIVCWIIVIVYLVTCIILLVIYCVMQWEFDSDSSSFIPTYIVPACILTVIGIVVTVVVSRVAEKDCSIGACLVGPLIVSVIESWIPMIVICIHSKCCVPKKYCLCCGNWKVTTGNNGGSSCFGGNNSILPICTGTDQGPQQSLGGVKGDGRQYPAKGQKNKQKPDHGRQKPDGDNGKHPDHGKQHLDHGKQRPLPLAGGDDGLQQNNEALQFKPRKLPEIPPGGEKSIRGISANFDKVVPDKKRLTPIGKETIEKFDEESPRKKKKKKKDKGKDTSVEYDY